MLASLENFRENPKSVVREFNSTLLEGLWDHLKIRKHKLRIVDLGSINGNNIEFLSSQFKCKVYVADFSELIIEQSGLMIGRYNDRLFDHGSTFFLQGAKIDLILIWDLLNYVSSKQANTWFNFLSAYCSGRTVIYVMMATQNRIPSNPGQYEILTSSRLRCEYSMGDRESPRYSQSTLSKIMPGFVAKRCYLFKNGMQECIYKFKGT